MRARPLDETQSRRDSLDAKPAYELIDGQLVQKMSPKMRHSLLQQVLATKLAEWAGDSMGVGPEWRFRISDGAKRHALVPDVACVARERLLAVPRGEAREEPPYDLAALFASVDRFS